MGRRDSVLNGRLILVVGSRRSGTQLVQRLLCTSPFVTAIPQETHLFSHGIAPLYERIQHNVLGSADIGRIYADEDILDDAVRDLCDAVLAPHLRPPAAFLVERTPVHAFHLDLIGRIYPDAAVVHVLRDGRDVARSLVRQPWGPSDLRTAAVAWRQAVLAAQTAGHPRYLEVRYEDLFGQPGRVLELFASIGIPPPRLEQVEAELGRIENVDPTDPRPAVGKWRSSYTAEELKVFNEVAGDLLAELGYETSEAPPRPPERAAAGDPGNGAGDGDSGWRVHDIHGDPTGPLDAAQELFERLLGALRRRDAAALAGLLAPAPRLRAHDYPGYPVELDGLDALMELLRADTALDGVQVRGDIVPSFPIFSAVLAFRTRVGRVEHRVVYAVLSGGRVRGLVLYRLRH